VLVVGWSGLRAVVSYLRRKATATAVGSPGKGLRSGTMTTLERATKPSTSINGSSGDRCLVRKTTMHTYKGHSSIVPAHVLLTI